MLKLGVVTRGGVRRPRTFLGRRRYVSLLLLRELARDPEAAADDYDRLAGHACMPNGVWKLTGHGRLRVLDDTVMDILQKRHERGARLDVCDLAASTGATSLDFFRALQRRFDVRFTASDLYRDVIAVCDRRRRRAIIFDGAGREVVQYVFRRFVFPKAPAESALYPVNRALKALLQRTFVPVARAVLGSAPVERLRPFESVEVEGYDVVKLPILTRDTLAAIDAEDGFGFEAWSILDRLPQRAHVIRAMNILTPEHFSDELRMRAIRNCVDAVVSGGIFIVGSSPSRDPAAVQASIYSVGDGQVVRLASLNGGSEIDALVARSCRALETPPEAREA